MTDKELIQPEPKPVAWMHRHLHDDLLLAVSRVKPPQYKDAIPLYTLEQPGQKPVAWVSPDVLSEVKEVNPHKYDDAIPLYTSPQFKQAIWALLFTNWCVESNRQRTTLKTTLNKIREYNPCKDGWAKLLKYLGKTKSDDEPLSLLTILDSNGVEDTLWCLRARRISELS